MVRRTKRVGAPRSPRVVARQEAMRDQIVRAAAVQFASRGYYATTVQDLAKATGLSAPSLYTYFPGKLEILEALASATERELSSRFEEPLPTGLSFPERFEALLQRLVAFVGEHRDAVSFLFTAPKELASGADPAGLHGFALVCGHFTRWLEAHARRKDLGRFTPVVAAQYLTGLVFAGFFRWLSGQTDDVAKLASEIRELFFEGVSGRGP